MANQVFINEDNIIECQVVGAQTVQSVERMGREIKTLLSRLETQHMSLLLLDDIREMGAVPPKARNVVISLGKTLRYDRLAMLGTSGLLRFGANLLLRAMGKSRKVRYFSDQEEAMAWLMEQKSNKK
jgi:hypothetical protein